MKIFRFGITKIFSNFVFLLTVTQGLCDVQLVSSDLICGQPAVLNCTVDPFDVISWDRNSAFLVNCLTSGSCTAPNIGNISFSVDRQSSSYILTIDPLEYGENQDEVFQCSDPIDGTSITLDVTVPLASVEVHTIETQPGVFQLNATTNCLKSTENTTFEWTCTSVDMNQTVSGICNVSTVTTTVNNSSCDTGGYCTGAGLLRRVNMLTFENYADDVDAEDVNLKVTVTSVDGTSVTYTSKDVFRLKKNVPSLGNKTVRGPEVTVAIVVSVFVLSVLIIVVIVLIKKKCTRCKVSQGIRYVVIIITGNMDLQSSDTVFNAWINIIGKNGQETGKILLRDKDGTGFKPGTTKTFDLDAVAVGNINKISLGCNANLHRQSVWYVKQVMIKVLEKDYTFKYECYIPTDENGVQRKNDTKPDATNIHLGESKKPDSHLHPIGVHCPTPAATYRSDTESEGIASRQHVEPVLSISSELSEGEKASRQRDNSKKKKGSRQKRGLSANYDNNVETEYPIQNSGDRPLTDPPTYRTKTKKKKKRKKEMQQEGTNPHTEPEETPSKSFTA